MSRHQRTCLLVSPGLLGSARAVYSCPALPARPQVCLTDGGRFLSVDEARTLAPWADEGLDYVGTFLDGLSNGAFSMVVPLLEDNCGAVQGMLEFLGVPYVGCGMTSLLLVRDKGFCRAVLGSLGLRESTNPASPGITVAILGNQELVSAPQDDPEAVDFAKLVYRGLGLGGWAVVVVTREGSQFGWREVQVQPELVPGGTFLRAFHGQGLDLGSLVSRVLGWGLSRHQAEVGLKNHFKDKI